MRFLTFAVLALAAACRPGGPVADSGVPTTECDVVIEAPAVLDFGAVARGDRFELPLTVANAGPGTTVASVGAVVSASPHPPMFELNPSPASAQVTIAPGEQHTFAVAFAPVDARDELATLAVSASNCPDTRIHLVGTGVDSVLTWAPATVEFGYATPGVTVSEEVVFSNIGFRPVQLSQLGTYEGTAFSPVFEVTATGQSDLSRLTIPAAHRPRGPADPLTASIEAATARASLSFKPTELGPRVGTLRAATDVLRQANISVPLRGVGGGPDIAVSPAPALDLGRIAYFVGVGSFATRRLTISNSGTEVVFDPNARLRLGVAGTGAFWTVAARNANTQASELCVGVFDAATSSCTNSPTTSGSGSYDPTGIKGGDHVDLPVSAAPLSLGLKEWDLTIFSNDPDEPGVTVQVRANVVSLPPCQFTMTPLALSFGTVTAPAVQDVTVHLQNLAVNAGDVCVISSVDLVAGSDPAFSLPAGPIVDHELGPGDTMNVVVRVGPQGPPPPGPVNIVGAVHFSVSSPTRGSVDLGLTATVAP